MSENAWHPGRSPWTIAFTVTLATFMEVLDTSIANVALRHIAGSLSAGVDESTWVLTSYLVANAAILPLAGLFASIFGRKRFYMISVGIFTASSLLCGLAPSLGWLIAFRVLQGLGGGGLQPCEQAILIDTFPERQRGMGMAIYGLAVLTAPIVGPTLGGWITDHFAWRWIFFINVPVGIVSMLLTQRIVTDPPWLKHRPLGALSRNAVGISVIALGLGAFQIMLDKGQRQDWFDSGIIWVLAVIAAAGLVYTLIAEALKRRPIVEVRLLLDRNFLLANILMFFVGWMVYGSTVLLPLFLQTLAGYSATLAGLVMSPGGLVTVLCMPLVGLAVSRLSPRWLIAFGLAVASLALWQMGRFTLEVSYSFALQARVIQALGLAFLFVPINAAAYTSVPDDKHTQASSIINLSRNLGGGVGIAMVTTWLERWSQINQHRLSGHLSLMDPAYVEAFRHRVGLFVWQGHSTLQSERLASASLYQDMVRQARLGAYVSNFRVIAIGCACLAVLVLALMRVPRPSSTKAPLID